MATIPGLKNIDPIQGLVSYVQDIKPYHSKIFEVLVEYVYQDLVNVTIVDNTTLELDIDPSDTVETSILETGITEMFDFFIIAPTPIAFNVTSYDSSNGIVSITATTPNPSQVNQIPPGSVLVIAGTFYDVSQSVYSAIPNSYVITLNITPPLSISGSGTAYNVDTSYSFTLPILSFHTGVTITEPVTGTSFSGSTFVVSGNATTAIQPGSIFKIKETNANYYTQYVQFVPAFAIDGAHVPALNTTIIGVSPASADFPAAVTTGTIIPYRTTGYDNPYDASYDRMAGYQLNYPAH